MADGAKQQQAQAMIAALQTILDRLPEDAELLGAEDEEAETPSGMVPDLTHELFLNGLDMGSLAGLFTSIRIIHTLHNANR